MDLGEEDAEEKRDAGDTESGSIEEDRCVSLARRAGRGLPLQGERGSSSRRYGGMRVPACWA